MERRKEERTPYLDNLSLCNGGKEERLIRFYDIISWTDWQSLIISVFLLENKKYMMNNNMICLNKQKKSLFSHFIFIFCRCFIKLTFWWTALLFEFLVSLTELTGTCWSTVVSHETNQFCWRFVASVPSSRKTNLSPPSWDFSAPTLFTLNFRRLEAETCLLLTASWSNRKFQPSNNI